MKISTLTLNPAVDLVIGLDELKPVIVNRTNTEDYQANGKAINISFILKKLGIDNKAMGYLGGFTGEYIKKVIEDAGIGADFIKIEGTTRINVFINVGEEYRIVNKGPLIKEENIIEILRKIEDLEEESYLFVSGSLPRGIEEEIFLNISEICERKKINLIFDISSKKLLDCLVYRPYLVKPNEEELAEFFEIGHELNEEEIINYSKRLLEMGARKIIVSRGDKGSIYSDKERTLKVTALKGKIVNTACAGDTLVGSFVGRLILGDMLEEALKYASVAASLTAFTEGLADLEKVKDYISEVEIINL